MVFVVVVVVVAIAVVVVVILSLLVMSATNWVEAKWGVGLAGWLAR